MRELVGALLLAAALALIAVYVENWIDRDDPEAAEVGP
jgi:hypothetical protein